MKLIKIEKDGCRPCQQLKLELHAHKDEFDELDVVIKEINISSNEEAIEKYDIAGVPTVILVDDSKEVWRKVGFVKAEEILEKIEELEEEE